MLALRSVLFLPVLIFVTTSTCIGQNLNWEVEIKPEENEAPVNIINYEADKFYTLNKGFIGMKEYHFVKEINGFDYGNEVEVLEPILGGNERPYLFKGENNTWIFKSTMKSKLKEISVSAQELTEGEPKELKLFNLNYEKKWYRNDPKFFAVQSANLKKFGLAQIYPSKGQDIAQLTLMVVDAQLNEIWKDEVDIEFSGGVIDIQEIVLSNSGVLYLISKRYSKEKSHLGEDNRDYDYMISSFDQSGGLKNKVIEISGSSVQALKFIFQNDENPLLLGVGKKESGKFYFFNLSYNDGNMTDNEINEMEIKKAIAENGNSRDMPMNFKHLHFNQCFPDSDGGFYAIGQIQLKYRQENRYHQREGGMPYYSAFEKNQVFILRINESGQMIWADMIDKKQYSKDDEGYFLGYTVLKKDDGVAILFNDDSENEELIEEDKPAQKFIPWTTHINTLRLVEIGSDGIMTTQFIEMPDDEEIHLSPQGCIGLDNNRFYLFGVSKSPFKHYLGTLTF